MSRPQFPLVVKVALVLAATGLLPIAISFFQLRTNKDALLDQVQRTHMVAAATIADRIETDLASLGDLARSLAENPALYGDAHSPQAAELVRGTLLARPDLFAVLIFNSAGEEVLRANRREFSDDAPEVTPLTRGLDLLDGTEHGWLAIRHDLPQDLGQLILVTRAERIRDALRSDEMGETAQLALGSGGDLLFASGLSAADFPSPVLEAAASGKLRSGVKMYRRTGGEDLVVAYAVVSGTPWFVLSRQPASVAEIAQRRIRQATWVAVLGALLLTAGISRAAYVSVIVPLRRTIRAQRELAGVSAAPLVGSEIEQLEEAFRLLEQRVHDQEDLGKVALGRYRVVDVLGSGAMGTVFEAWDPKLDRPVAIKTVRMTGKDIDHDRLLANLLREAATSARFSHPNIVTVYDVAEQGSAAFIAMELIKGRSLAEYLDRRGPLPWRQVVPVGAAIAHALAAAHAEGLVHHDIKPANVLLGRDRSIKVTDFGISQLITSVVEDHDLICGTPGYIAPESLEGAGYDFRSDLFALGVVLYECLSGRHPFAAANLRATVFNTITAEPEPMGVALPPELEQLVLALLAKNPDDRPEDAAAVAAVFDELVHGHRLTWTEDAAAAAATLPVPDTVPRPRVQPRRSTQLIPTRHA